MKKVILLVSCVLYSFFVMSQENEKTEDFKLGLFDLCIIKVRINSRLFQAKDYCFYKKGTRADLYHVDILQLMHYSANNFFDSLALKKMEYLIAKRSYRDSLLPGREYLVSISGTKSKQYVGLSRILHLRDNVHYNFHYGYGFIKEILDCGSKHRDRFEGYILKKTVYP